MYICEGYKRRGCEGVCVGHVRGMCGACEGVCVGHVRGTDVHM